MPKLFSPNVIFARIYEKHLLPDGITFWDKSWHSRCKFVHKSYSTDRENSLVHFKYNHFLTQNSIHPNESTSTVCKEQKELWSLQHRDAIKDKFHNPTSVAAKQERYQAIEQKIAHFARIDPRVDADAYVNNTSYACLLLNRPIHPQTAESFLKVWDGAVLRVCIDGALRRLHKLRRGMPPHWVCGDMDSSTWIPTEDTNKEHQLEYENFRKLVKWRVESEQDTSDLQKGFRLLQDQNFSALNVVIWGSGGRLDHEFANINTMLIETKKSFPNNRIIIIGEENFMEILCPGEHCIVPNHELESGTCGLIPLTSSATVFTEGLKWNLNGEKLAIGGMVSTSNNIESESVWVRTDSPLLWISVLKQGMQDQF